MGKGKGWFGLRRDSSGSKHTAEVRAFGDDPEGTQLCGVGIVLVKAPDNSLFVKGMVEGSSACNCGIMPGDCLMEVSGKNVYCKGIDFATKAILGKEGTVVTLKLIRIEKGKRIPVSASLVREMKATANPEFKIKSQNSSSSGISTSQVHLECLQQDMGATSHSRSQKTGAAAASWRSSSGVVKEKEEEEEEEEEEEDDEEAGAGVFGGGSTNRSCRPCRETVLEGCGGGRFKCGDEAQGRQEQRERRVQYKGVWYTESEIDVLEEKAKEVKEELDRFDSLLCSKGGGGEEEVPERQIRGVSSVKEPCNAARLIVGPSLVDLGKGPKPLSKKEESLNSDPEALKAAILVVEGMKVDKVSTRKLVGRTLKAVTLKMSTGGMLSWGKGKSGHVMWVKALKEQYEPNMSKEKFLELNRKLYVMLEGDQVWAHSSEGGMIRATESPAALEFIAASREDRDTLVKGIDMVLSMAKKEALERETRKRLQEVHSTSPNLPSFFVTQKLSVSARMSKLSESTTQDEYCDEDQAAEIGAGERPPEAIFGSDDQRENVRRADARACKGWGGKISMFSVAAETAHENSDEGSSITGDPTLEDSSTRCARDSPSSQQHSSTDRSPSTSLYSSSSGLSTATTMEPARGLATDLQKALKAGSIVFQTDHHEQRAQFEDKTQQLSSEMIGSEHVLSKAVMSRDQDGYDVADADLTSHKINLRTSYNVPGTKSSEGTVATSKSLEGTVCTSQSLEDTVCTSKSSEDAVGTSKSSEGTVLAKSIPTTSGLPRLSSRRTIEAKNAPEYGINSITETETILACENKCSGELSDAKKSVPTLAASSVLGSTPVGGNVYKDDLGVIDIKKAEMAIKHQYDPKENKWARTVINVVVQSQPFAEGNLRKAFHIKDLSVTDSDYVLKISKDPAEDAQAYFDDVKLQMEAKMYAEVYNSHNPPKKVDFLDAYVLELKDRPDKPICAVEKFISGDYKKYNNNWSFCDDRRNTPQAFSHFSYEHSKHTILICDIQGVGDTWTDPQIHSRDGKGYGKGNLGQEGIDKFLESHKCNQICQWLRLPTTKSCKGSKEPKEEDAGTYMSTRVAPETNLPAGEEKLSQPAASQIQRNGKDSCVPAHVRSPPDDSAVERGETSELAHAAARLKAVPAPQEQIQAPTIIAGASSLSAGTTTTAHKTEEKVVVEEPVWPPFLNPVETKEKKDEGSAATEQPGLKLHTRQDVTTGRPLPKVSPPPAGKKLDFAALMRARQEKQRQAEEADEGMYFN